MKNNFQEWQDAEENEAHGLAEIENNLIRQVETFSLFGRVIELFIPNALNTVAKMIGGTDYPHNTEENNRRGNSPESSADAWRTRGTGVSGTSRNDFF